MDIGMTGSTQPKIKSRITEKMVPGTIFSVILLFLAFSPEIWNTHPHGHLGNYH